MSSTGEKISITYVGRRLFNDKLAHVFLYGKKELHFRSIKYARIGANYEATKNGENVTISQIPKEIEGAENPEQIEKWKIEDQIATQKRKAWLGAKNSNKSDAVQRVASILKPVTKGMSFSDRRLLMESIIDELHREETEEMNRRIRAKFEKALKRSKK